MVGRARATWFELELATTLSSSGSGRISSRPEAGMILSLTRAGEM